MGEKIDAFCEGAKSELTDIESGVSKLKSFLEEFTRKDEMAFEAMKNETMEKAESVHHELERRSQGLADKARRLKEETSDRIAEWKQSREQKKLEQRAEDAADYARESLVVATLAIREAQAAIVEAVAARRDVENVPSKAA